MPDRGIAGISLGMSQAKVRSVLGPPLRVIRRPNEITVADTEFRYTRLSVVFAGDPTSASRSESAINVSTEEGRKCSDGSKTVTGW